MTTNGAGDRLSAKRYVTVPLRLLVDQAGGLVQGEIVDLQGRSLCRFVGWRGLNDALRAALVEQAGEQLRELRPSADR